MMLTNTVSALSGSRCFRRAGVAALLALCAAATPALADPVVIDYELITLAAPNQYEYRYTVRNVSLAPSLKWFSIDFDASLYLPGSITITSAGVGDWAEGLLTGLPGDPPEYDLYNLVSEIAVGESVAGFAVQFTWTGGGAGPGSQTFTLYDPNSLGGVNELGTGVTTPLGQPPTGMPEPASLMLALTALMGAGAARRRTVSAATVA
jgi:hypothetical protein